jgi:hypothetical protein
MILKDVKEHFYNGSDRIISARYEGKRERYLFFNGVQFTEKEEAFYRKANNPLPIIDIDSIRNSSKQFCTCN